jgi:putative ATP-dependent endonuclease of OLD family
MTLIRVLEIENFRAIRKLRWLPGPGVNCLIGPGDCGKTATILDAIDLCVGARRSLSFTDVDFHGIDFDQPIRISVTLGALDDPLKNIDSYGDFLVGFNAGTGLVEPEPGAGVKTALMLQPTVRSDLEPEWSLISPRAQAAGRTRNLNWADRTRIASARLGAEQTYRWQGGCIERADPAGPRDAGRLRPEGTQGPCRLTDPKGGPAHCPPPRPISA